MGRNVVQRLQDGGIEAKKGTQVTVPVGDIWAPPKGHPLYHPRFGDPVDPEMRDDILARGVEKPIKVRDDGVQDDGAPLGLLAAVLDAPRAEQVATLDKLLAAGVRTAKGATRKANAEKAARDPWARRMSPRQACEVGIAVSPSSDFATAARVDPDVLRSGIRIGLYLAANRDIDKILKTLPKPIADAIREARATKPARAS